MDYSPKMTEVTMFARIMWLGAALTLSVAPVSRSQSPVTLAQATHVFHMGTIPERIQAFYALDRIPGSWTQAGAAQALLALLEREDVVIVAVLRESGGRLAAGDKYGEGYAEYDGQLEDRCLKYCDQDALLTHLLANIRDVPELRQGSVDLLTATYVDARSSPAQRARIDAAFIAAARDSTSYLTRAEAVRVIGVGIRSGLTSPADRARFHQAVIAAASDAYRDVRLAAIRRLGELRDPADSSLLQRLAATDTARNVKNGATTYPLRDAARAALSVLKKPAP